MEAAPMTDVGGQESEQTMDLAEAVGILNECRHRGGNDWKLADISSMGSSAANVVSSHITNNLTAFEAIAIAEKYKEGETPESIMQ